MREIFFLRALKGFERAVAIEPDCSETWNMPGRLYANIHGLDMPGYESPLEKAHERAAKGIKLAPNSQCSRSIMAYVYLFRNEMAAGLAETKKT